MKIFVVMEIWGKDCGFPHSRAFTDNKEDAEKIAAKMQEFEDGFDFDNKPEDGVFFRVAQFDDYPLTSDIMDALKKYNKERFKI